MMIGIGIPNSQSRIGMFVLLRIRSAPGARDEATVGPGAVAELAAFDRSQSRRERAEQEIGGHPECHPRGAAACAVRGGLGLRHHIVHAFFGIGLAHAGLRRNQARDVRSVWGGKFAVSAEAGGPQARNLGPRVLVRAGSLRRRRCIRTEEAVDVNLRGIDACRGLTGGSSDSRCGAAENLRGRRPEGGRTEDSRERPRDEAMRGVAKEHLVGIKADPSGTQAGRQIAADSGGHDRDQHQVDSRSGLEGRGGDARVAHGEMEDRPRPAPKARSARVKAAVATAPAAMLAHDAADIPSPATDLSVWTIVSMVSSGCAIISGSAPPNRSRKQKVPTVSKIS